MSEQKLIPISDASFKQLAAHATSLGLEVKIGTNTAQLRAKIEAAFPGTSDINVDVAPAAPAPATAASPVAPAPIAAAPVEQPAAEPVIGTSYHFDPKVSIRIPPTKEPGGDRAVPLACNGDTVLVQRGVIVDIPYRFYESSLNDAVEEHFEFQTNSATKESEMVSRMAHSYEFSIMKMPPEEEVAAWRERVSKSFAP